MNTQTLFQKGLPHFIAFLIFLVASVIYFMPQLKGKVGYSGDARASIANAQEIITHRKKTGETSLWTNSLFGGMPTYQIGSNHPNNLSKEIDKASRFYIPAPIGRFLSGMVIFYIMLVLLGVNPWLSIVGALAFGLTTNNFILYGAGHITKVRAIIHLGLVTAGVLLAFRKKYLLGGLVFGIGLALELWTNHVQMTYYFFLTLIIYGLIELGYHIKKKEMASFGKAVMYLVIGGGLAFGSSASRLWTTYEYSKDTMRGDPILALDANVDKTSSNVSGLEYGYATKWSNGWMDLFAGFIPELVGGGSSNGGPKGKVENRVAYWGANSDGTAGPAYYGAIVCFLFLFGLLIVKGPVKWWLLGGVLLISLISLGKNFPLHGMLYDLVPFFNKFRTPNSALSVVAFMVPILGFLAVDDVIKGKVSKNWMLLSLYISGGFILAVCLFYALFGGAIFDFIGANDAAYAQQINMTSVQKLRADMMSASSWRSIGLILAAGALFWFFIKDKISQTILIAGLGILIFGDLWSVDKRYLTNDFFVEKSKYKQLIAPRPVDTKILADKDTYYRVFDVSKGLGNAVNSTDPSYFHKNIGGYHPAKLQRYQDLLDRCILPEGQRLIGTLQQAKSLADVEGVFGSLPVLNMLNTKYIIANNDSPIPNRNALGNSWFVESFKLVDTPNQEIDGLRGINPSQTAIVLKEFSDYLSDLKIQKNGTIQLTSYAPDHLTYSATSTSNQLAVFSEVWYGPDKGWNAYIDGTPVDHIRVNYALRGLKVPSGQHSIEFKFEPRSYNVGEIISLITSLLLLLGLLAYVYFYFKGANEKTPEKSKDARSTVKPTQSTVKKTKSKSKGKKKK